MSSSSGMKVKISLGWSTDYIFDAEDAIKFIQLLSKGEVYQTKYDSDTKETTQHIYPVDPSTNVAWSFMSSTVYHVAKMAGKPE